ncbi:MAG: orc1/cdc6 family replication initiation protein [Candidatus Micrarchaeota archaeon]|nr:orc1/cdc6 family replication initiation protein [Candidatus Micrarchaeota archaeon]
MLFCCIYQPKAGVGVCSMSKSFSEILSKPTVFADRNVLSPHYVPEVLPFREGEILKIMEGLSPVFNNQRPRNMFIYGKTGTGKTASVKHVISKFESYNQQQSSVVAKAVYVNCRMYNSRYRVVQKITKELLPDVDSMGFGLALLYEKMKEEIMRRKMHLVVVLDEVDMVKDLDDLLYTLTRSNDELQSGSVSIIGISNKLSFKDQLDPRSKSSLCENEFVFPTYTAPQLQEILAQRAKLGFKEGAIEEPAINLIAAITAQESGDARYALRLLIKSGEIADEKGATKITDREVEEARRSVDRDVAFDAICTLPDHQQLVLLAIANLSLDKSKISRLGEKDQEDDFFLTSGEVYEEYCKVARKHRKPRRSARWYREYLNDLEMLGLITTVESGAGMRGRTRLIRIGYPPSDVKKIIEKNFTIIEAGE